MFVHFYHVQVCGSDGVTYLSVCHLRTQSANAQVDYRGACVDGGDRGLRDICIRVREDESRCEDTEEMCENRVLSSDGCCPVCGEHAVIARYRIAGNFHGCKFSRKCLQTLQKKFSWFLFSWVCPPYHTPHTYIWMGD